MAGQAVAPSAPTRAAARPIGRRPRVSVLTASRLAPDRAPMLMQLHADLDVAHVPWEWVLVVDGDRPPEVPRSILADPRVRTLRLGRSVGAAAARNLGLGLATGDYICMVDDDDRLPPWSLARRVAAAAERRVGWVAGMLADLRGDAVTVWKCPMPPGLAAPGDVWRAWGCPCMPFPLGPMTLLVEADLMRSVGGWHGLPQAEDFGMALAVTGRTAGVVLDDVVYLYRRHASQMTTGAEFDVLEPLVRHITYERGRLLCGPPVGRMTPAVAGRAMRGPAGGGAPRHEARPGRHTASAAMW